MTTLLDEIKRKIDGDLLKMDMTCIKLCAYRVRKNYKASVDDGL